MFNNKRVDDALPPLCSRNLSPEITSASAVSIFGGSFTDVAGDYHHHGDVFNIHNSHSSELRRWRDASSTF